MSADGELETWRRQWQSKAVPAADADADADAVERLRRRVLRETRSLKLLLIWPILVTVVVGGAVTFGALRARQLFQILLAAEVWIFIAVIWTGCIWIARGTWRPLADTTAAFVDISIRRREANMRAGVFGACLYVAQLVFTVVAQGTALPGGFAAVLPSIYVIVLGWVGVPAVLAAMYWFRRRDAAELERLRELKRQLQSD